MSNENTVFGINSRESVYDRYVGKYVVILLQGGSSSEGRLKEIQGCDFILNPFVGTAYENGRNIAKGLVYGDKIINSVMMLTIEPITKKSLENYCAYSNHVEPNKKVELKKVNSLKQFLQKFLPK